MDFDFPSENNRYMKHLSPYVANMKEGEDKSIEVDDRYGVYVKACGDNKYTGWIYYEGTDVPTMAFRNETLKNIVKDAYELGIFTNETTGMAYNNAAIDVLNQEITQSIDQYDSLEIKPCEIQVDVLEKDMDPNYYNASPTFYEYSTTASESQPSIATPVEIDRPQQNITYFSDNIYALAEFVEHLVLDYNGKNVLATEVNGIMEITLLKSLASELCKAYPIFTEKQALSLVLTRALTKSNPPVKHIKDALSKLVEYKKEGKIKDVVKEHEKIDHELHAMVGEEGLRPEEKTKKNKDDKKKFSAKVEKLMNEGYPQKQALAIAYDMQKRGEI